MPYRTAPSTLGEDFDSYASAPCSIPATPSPGGASSAVLMRRGRDRKGMPPALSEEYWMGGVAMESLASPMPQTPSPMGLMADAAWRQQFAASTVPDIVSLGCVEAGSGITVGPMYTAPPPLYAAAAAALQEQQPMPPPPDFAPRVFSQDFSEPPPAPAYQPQCLPTDFLDAGAAEMHAVLSYLSASQPPKGSRLAEQLAAPEASAGFRIKNTFIDDGVRRSPSLENVLRGRQVHSCPGSRLPSPRGKHQEPVSSTASTVDTSEGAQSEESQKWGMPPTPTLQMNAWNTPGMEHWMLQEAHALPEAIARQRLQLEHALLLAGTSAPVCPPPPPAIHGGRMAPPSPHSAAMAAASIAAGGQSSQSQGTGRSAQVLQLERALAFDGGDPDPASFEQALHAASRRTGTPELGSPELPSIGSLGHSIRRCKPCAFSTRLGCSNGLQCQFCHLCEAGEKKRRRKEKRALIGAARKLVAADAMPLQ